MGRTQEKQMGENVKGSNNNKIPQAPKVNLKKRTLKKEKWQEKMVITTQGLRRTWTNSQAYTVFT